jgi:hypothetical protein
MVWTVERDFCIDRSLWRPEVLNAAGTARAGVMLMNPFALPSAV